jgi:hypothetical protein
LGEVRGCHRVACAIDIEEMGEWEAVFGGQPQQEGLVLKNKVGAGGSFRVPFHVGHVSWLVTHAKCLKT